MNMPRLCLAVLALFWSTLAGAQGTLPITLTQQFSFSGCSTSQAACGTPLNGGLLYFYQVGTVATPQNSYSDPSLADPQTRNPWPLTLDANGRVPAFYLANGSIHVRLTDASGVVQFEYPNMLVIGPSSGGGGGSSVDPTSISSTGDIKFRATGETLAGWVKMNGLTIGSSVSGSTGRANADTQSLFTYLWTNCPDAHCPVLGGRGATSQADFTANKQLTVLDWRARGPVGLDDMGAPAAGRMLASNVTSGGGDTVTTPGASGGAANRTITQAQLPNYALTVTDPGHTHVVNINASNQFTGAGAQPGFGTPSGVSTQSATTGVTVNSGGSGALFDNMNPFVLGTWHIKL